jgi:hypothetical protein
MKMKKSIILMNTKTLSENISPEDFSAEDFLRYGVQLLKDRNINYWLDCGTLLGIVRSQSLIPWDKDLDISILKSDLSESDIAEIVIKVRNDGYEVNVYESCISITKNEYVFDGASYSAMRPFNWSEKLNKNEEWRFAEQHDVYFNFKKGYQILMYYQS